MNLGELFIKYQTEIITSLVFIVISIGLLAYLTIVQSKKNRAKKSIVGGLLSIVAILSGVTALLSIQEKNGARLDFISILVVDFLIVVVYTTLSLIVLRAHKQGTKPSKITTKTVALLGVLIGFASVLQLAGIPVMPAAPFLKLEISALIVFMVMIWFGFKYAILVSLATNLIHVYMPSLTAPVIPYLDEGINFLATMCFMLPSAILFNKKSEADKPSAKKVWIATGIGVAFTTVFMVFYNAWVNLPIIYKIEMPFSSVVEIFGIFNVLKWGTVFLVINLLWRKLYNLKDIKNQE